MQTKVPYKPRFPPLSFHKELLLLTPVVVLGVLDLFEKDRKKNSGDLKRREIYLSIPDLAVVSLYSHSVFEFFHSRYSDFIFRGLD
jgi:hypothetical protein